MKTKLKQVADLAYSRISIIRGLKPVKSTAAMYMMINIDMEQFTGFEDDVDFCK